MTQLRATTGPSFDDKGLLPAVREIAAWAQIEQKNHGLILFPSPRSDGIAVAISLSKTKNLET